MTYEEVKMSLFDVDDDYVLVHCVSADFALGAGIAAEFANRFHVKEILQNTWGTKILDDWISGEFSNGCCVSCYDKTSNRVILNLVTKERYWHKPTYKTLKSALIGTRGQIIMHKFDKIAMPKIGCGLDRLDWNKVRDIIFDVFADTAIEIKVCYL